MPQCVNGVYLLAKDKLIMVVLSVPGKVKIFSTYTSASVWERLSEITEIPVNIKSTSHDTSDLSL